MTRAQDKTAVQLCLDPSLDQKLCGAPGFLSGTHWLLQGRVMGNPSKACMELGWQHNSTVALIVNEMVDADLAVAVRADKTLDQ